MKKKTEAKGKKISKKMSFNEILEKTPEAANILMARGMHCCGCPLSGRETLEEGAKSHGLDADEIVEEINKKQRKK